MVHLEKATGGTLLIDEISEIPLETQSKILRVLTDQKFKRINGNHDVKVNVRIICTSSKNIINEIKLGNFHEDLFYRLNVFQIAIEPLSKRVEDIPLLIDYFSSKISNSYNLKKLNISGDNSYLINHSWPGNVRELRNLIERIAILANNNNDKISTIIKESIKQEENETYSESNFSVPLKKARENFEKDYLTTQLKKFGGNVSKTAKFVGMERSALHRKLKRSWCEGFKLMNIIICGAGRVGYTIAKLLSEQDHSITVIDQSSEDIQKINDDLDVKSIVGKATFPTVLEKANAEEADMIIAVTRSDEINMLICQIAFSVFKISKKIARIRSQEYLDTQIL